MLHKHFKWITPAILFACMISHSCTNNVEKVDWPEFTSQAKPWSRWWWQGSSVTKEGITAELEAYEKAGIGGLELTPIYGVIGDESNFIEYLGPEWMEMLEYTLAEAQRLDLGIDMANGTGWPFGGPWVNEEDACKYLAHQTYTLQGGQKLDEKIIYEEVPMVRAVNNLVYQTQMTTNDPEIIAGKKALQIEDLVEPIEKNVDLQGKALDQVRYKKLLPLVSLMAFGPDQTIDLTNKVNGAGILDWVAPEGDWRLYAVFQGWHGKMVERAAPGGEGNVIDHFSAKAIRHYLSKFDSAFAGRDIGTIRAFFNDSYEVDDARGQANWTSLFFEDFEKRRGYDLRLHLPALFGEDTPEHHIRVLSDYRETFSDLILETFTQEWASWAKDKGKIIRNQSHGSPANIMDLYAASDIPETEGTEILRIKFASSAAHVAGRALISAEAATWLNEHFLSKLSDVKENLDRYLVGGINHVFYHGTCYSPPEESWPGRLFYAAIHNNPRNPLWHHWSTLNQYIARIQSFLQAGRSDNDILLYFPMYDRFATPGPELLEHFDGYGPTLEGTPVETTALYLQENGFTFDFISDRQIADLKLQNHQLETGGTSFKTIVIPPCRFMPLTTLMRLQELARQGALVIFKDGFPTDVPGLKDLESRKMKLAEIIADCTFDQNEHFAQASIGVGHFYMGEDLAVLLDHIHIERESLVDHNLEFVRRQMAGQCIYFVSNWSQSDFDGWVTLGKQVKSCVIFNPMTGGKGLARIRNLENGKTEIYLQLSRGEACILQAGNIPFDESPYAYFQKGEGQLDLKETWSLSFVEGGPELPPDMEMTGLKSWTELGDAHLSFSGRAVYRLEFDRPDPQIKNWLLDLGKVHETASIKLNGLQIGILVGPVYQIMISSEHLTERNVLEIEVANLMANRIADLDRRDVYWKKFYNVNFPPRRAENRGKNGLFDASDWEPLPSGLLGPVKMHALYEME